MGDVREKADSEEWFKAPVEAAGVEATEGEAPPI